MLTYEPPLDYGVFKVNTFGERESGFGTGLTQHDPMIQLWAMLKALQAHDPELMTDLRRACDALELDYAGGIAVAIRHNPTHRTRPCQPRMHPRQILPALGSETLFCIAQGVMAGDRTERIWRRRGFIYSDLKEELEYAVEEFEAGYDPHTPW